MIFHIKGDATQPSKNGKNKIIAHVCNNLGFWGKGFVLSLSWRWPFLKEEYQKFVHKNKKEGLPLLGRTFFSEVEEDILVANMIAQQGIRPMNGLPPIRYEALSDCLEKVAEKAKSTNSNVHMPKIGAGLAGGDWNVIEEMIKSKICGSDGSVSVYIYTLP